MGSEIVRAMADRIAQRVQSGGGVSFVELEQLFNKDEVQGDYFLQSPPNCIWWTGVSREFAESVWLCIDRGDIVPTPTSPIVYFVDGKAPNLPVAKRPPKRGYKDPRWLPVVFNPGPGAAKQGDVRYAQVRALAGE